MRPQPLISATDVPRSSRWYQELLSRDSGHGGEEYERLLHDGALVLQLHRFEVGHHHGRIGEPSSRPYGNGVAVWFETDDFDEAVRRAEHCTLTWYDPRTATRRMAPAGRRIESSGYAIRTATSWCSSAPTASPSGRIRACSVAWGHPEPEWLLLGPIWVKRPLTALPFRVKAQAGVTSREGGCVRVPGRRACQSESLASERTSVSEALRAGDADVPAQPRGRDLGQSAARPQPTRSGRADRT